MTKVEATLRPWKIIIDSRMHGRGWVDLQGADKSHVADSMTIIDAELTIKRVNQGEAFDALVKVCEQIQEWFEGESFQYTEEIEQALKLAKKEV